MTQRQNLKTLLEELLGPIHKLKDFGDLYFRVKRFPTKVLSKLFLIDLRIVESN